MSKTPIKNLESDVSPNFSPKELTTPNKDSPGVSKTVFTHISNIHGSLSDWIRVRDKGTKLCKTIAALKLHEFSDDYYPQSLIPLTDALLDALDGLRNIVEGIETIDKQLKALAKLQSSDQPVIFTWSARRISDNVEQILHTLHKELKLKEVITENIAHCRDENLIEVFVSAWEFEAYFNINSSAYLFAEVGLSGIT